MELLPEVEKQQLRSGNLTDGAFTSHEEVEIPDKFDVPQIQDSRSTSLLIPSSANPSLVLRKDHTSGLLSSSTLGISAKIGMSFPTAGLELGNFNSRPHHHEGILTNDERVPNHQTKIGKILRFDTTPTPRNHRIGLVNGSPLKGFNRASPSNSQGSVPNKLRGVESNLLFGHNEATSPMYSWKTTTNPVTSRNVQLHKDDRSWNIESANDPMDVSQR